MLLKPEFLSIAQEQLDWVNGWEMEHFEKPDHILVVYERIPTPAQTD